jgi:hypothetical protein
MDRPPACNLKSGPDGKLKSNLEWPNCQRARTYTASRFMAFPRASHHMLETFASAKFDKTQNVLGCTYPVAGDIGIRASFYCIQSTS